MLNPIVRLAIVISLSLPLQSALETSGPAAPAESYGFVNVKDYGARGDGITDDLPAINRAFAAVMHKGQRLLFPAGTYGISGTLVIPTKTQIFGVGRGDPGSANTVIKALPSFPRGVAVVQMGAGPGPDFGVQVENMTIDGSLIAGTCLLNLYSEEQSFGRNLILGDCTKAGLRVIGGAAQNSGPFENLEILPGPGAATNVDTLCVEINGVDAFRGMRGLTCNAGSSYHSRPALAMKLDGSGVYQDIHIEHFATAVTLGSSTRSADTLIFADGTFGPDVNTGLKINVHPGTNNQNLTILGLSCSSCITLLQDDTTGTVISDSSVGWYLLGNGPAKHRAVLSSNGGIGGQFFGPFRAPEVQLTSSGARPDCSASNRGTFWFVQSPPRVADHVQICSKSADDHYVWATIY